MSPSHVPLAIIFCAKPAPASPPAIPDVITLLVGKIVSGRPLRACSFVTRTLINIIAVQIKI